MDPFVVVIHSGDDENAQPRVVVEDDYEGEALDPYRIAAKVKKVLVIVDPKHAPRSAQKYVKKLRALKPNVEINCMMDKALIGKDPVRIATFQKALMDSGATTVVTGGWKAFHADDKVMGIGTLLCSLTKSLANVQQWLA
eukprot:CAMPEP_0169196520 /NCGR_PEP_ID=MMETSP1016-20121227/7776_1 /TAXON_ID=342587 /ORGANISM="Karlodinium micrum, Strain CCMP2283" /LENGTH=139 /DNA_ID=CAMNT_0009273101 /DNA_START=9 /DNA_END=424 /DNA_ORIENTATION=+